MKNLALALIAATAIVGVGVACTSTTDATDPPAGTADSGTDSVSTGGDAAPVALPPAESASQVVTAAAGGTVALSNSDGVSIPAGALATDATVSVVQTDPAVLPPKPDQMELVSRPVILTPHGLTFSKPVTLTLSYASTAPAANLVVMRLDNEADTTWEIVPGAKFADGKVTVETTHFSVWAVGTRLDDDATCDKICPTLLVCLGTDDNCAKGCGEARQACNPTQWKALLTCFNTAIAASNCDGVEDCIKNEACARAADSQGGDQDGGQAPKQEQPKGQQ